MSGRDKAFEIRFKNLCRLVSAHLEANDVRGALVLAAAFLIFRDFHVFSQLSKKYATDNAHGDVFVDRAQKREQESSDAHSLSGDALHGLFNACPLALVMWLDDKLMTAGDGVPHWGTASVVETVVLSEPERQALGLNEVLETFFVFARTQAHVRAPIEKQTHAPGRYMRTWEVTPAVPDPSQQSRQILALAPSQATVAALTKVAGAQSLRIYLAEYLDKPSFESAWQAGHERTLWRALGLQNEGDLVDQSRLHVKQAFARSADAIVFPELVVSAAVLAGIKAELRFQSANAPEKSPAWVVAGSFHIPVGEDLFNRAPVLDGIGNQITLLDGQALFHDKLTSVEISGAKIVEGNTVGTMIHLMPSPIGAHAVVICLDLGQAATMDSVPLERVPARWLWVPSMSPSVSTHDARAKVLCTQRALTVACANQASAEFGKGLSLDGEVGTSFVCLTQADRTGKSSPELPLGEGKTPFQLHVAPLRA